MTKQEHLIACLAEEAGEIVQACGKALRFGVNDGYPCTNRTNAQDIAREIAHLNAVAGMLKFDDTESEGVVIDRKLESVNKYMEYARRIGTLEPNIQTTQADGGDAPARKKRGKKCRGCVHTWGSSNCRSCKIWMGSYYK